MASISTKSVKSVKVKNLRINLFAAFNNNNIYININNTISLDICEEEKRNLHIHDVADDVTDDVADDAADGVSTEGVEKKSGYYYKNRDKKLEYQKKYNKEQGDKIKNYNKDYYQKRREEILEKAKTKTICDCGCEVQLFNMNSHKKTKKHLRALDAIKTLKKCEHV